MKNGGRKAWVLLLVLLAGVIIGGIVWLLLLKILPSNLDANLPIDLGYNNPLVLDLSLIKLKLGFMLNINPGSAAGLIAGLAFYFWRR